MGWGHFRMCTSQAMRRVVNIPALSLLKVERRGRGTRAWVGGHLECVGVSCWQRICERQKRADKSVRATRARRPRHTASSILN
jgi:hypothetical protein